MKTVICSWTKLKQKPTLVNLNEDGLFLVRIETKTDITKIIGLEFLFLF
jgi:hypothetical protein